ncbi:type I secretion system permease/ATPase [Pseudomonas edaphica]|uniref:Type I secretion system permease/ATPase n=1 Tax=Pseudomonas edaphica TaxID=2006980 RepID=A0ABY2UCG9_9PSED|nr:type I secretion system permease/ATPase [Pseudomonas edaphica]TLG94102.1 type I secretion system permease/ATPase [Pseudomonas edaphica]
MPADLEIKRNDDLIEMTECAEEQADSLLSAIRSLCELYHKEVSETVLYAGLPRGKRLSPALATRMLEQVGIKAGWVQRPLPHLSDYLFPAVQARKDGTYCVLLKRNVQSDQVTYDVIIPEHNGQVTMSEAQVQAHCSGYFLLTSVVPKLDTRNDNDLLSLDQGKSHWLFAVLWRYRFYFYSAALAALLANILTLAITFFTMNVYDRVVPTHAYVSLWSMAIGVLIAVSLEFASRQIRAYLLDVAGKKADLIIGARLFRQVMALRLESKPGSSGAFANQFREYEAVRDFVTSATLATLSDLPFCLLFLGIIYLIGGPLALVPILAVPVILVLSIACQWPLSRYMQENIREISLRQGLLIETLEGLEALKASRGEGVMQQRWDDFSALATASAMKSRFLSSLITNFVMFVQQIVTVLIVLWGVYLIHAGVLTMGAMIGVVILSGRSLAPLGAVVGLAVRYQQAKAGMKSLNRLMSLPLERDPGATFLQAPRFDGSLSLHKVSYSYPMPGAIAVPKALDSINLNIKAGERIVILGNIGSGKSTLLKIMARLYRQSEGRLAIDGVDASQVDPSDWRAAVGYVGQDCQLFYGSLRENVMIGSPGASTQHFLRIARMTGLDRIAARHPQGYEMPVGEMGHNLSGGQRQLIALARCLMLEPKILLLDEPTSAMDGLSEAQFIRQLSELSQAHTLIIVTHRMSMLSLADRLIVLEDGCIAADGPKAQVIAALNANGQSGASPASALP